MIIIILTILFGQFSTGFTIFNFFDPISKRDSNCQCSATSLDDIFVAYKHNNSLELSVNIKKWDNLEIVCKHLNDLKDVQLTSKSSAKVLSSLSFRHCGLSNDTKLINVIKKLGVDAIHALTFESFLNLKTLKAENFLGFQDLKKLSLSYNELTNISKDFFLIFPKLEWLDLSRNNLVISVNNFDELPNLRKLELIGNEIETIPVGAFDNLQNLESLNLMGNKLTEVEGVIFEELTSLKSLSLAMNSLTKLMRSTFYQLKKLESLDISMNNLFYIPSKLLIHNKELRQLRLNHNTGELNHLPMSFLSNFTKLEEVFLNDNRFKKLPENLFKDSLSLKYINLQNNRLKTLPKNIFKGLRNLKTLLLRNNFIEDLPTDIFENFEELQVLDMSMNLMTTIKKDLFENLISLSELNMERNRLIAIEGMAFFSMKNLTIINLSHNQLEFNSTSTKWSPFYSNLLLKELHLSNNSIKSFFSDWSISRYHLKLLDLSHNQISTISGNNFILPSEHIVVDLRYNNISNIVLHDIEDLAIYQNKERDIVVLVDHNPILCDCEFYELLRYANDKMSTNAYNYFQIKLGNLSCVYSDGTKGPQVTQFDLTTYMCPEEQYFGIETNCKTDCTCNIRLYDKTRVLDCSYRNLTEFSIDQRRIVSVRNYPLIVNLTGNFLTEVPSTEAYKPTNISGLLLSNNQISKVKMNQLPDNLTELELHNNNISQIDLEVLGYTYFGALKVFTLSGNPIKCNCDTKVLLRFILLKRTIYEDLNNVKCYNTNIPLYKMTSEELCQSERKENLISDEEMRLNEM